MTFSFEQVVASAFYWHTTGYEFQRDIGALQAPQEWDSIEPLVEMLEDIFGKDTLPQRIIQQYDLNGMNPVALYLEGRTLSLKPEHDHFQRLMNLALPVAVEKQCITAARMPELRRRTTKILKQEQRVHLQGAVVPGAPLSQ